MIIGGEPPGRAGAGTREVDLLYLGGGGLELARPDDDVSGMVVVDRNGHRVGEVDDLVIDARDRRARLLSVITAGIPSLGIGVRLIPVEAVSRVDDRVHLDRSHLEVCAQAMHARGTSLGPRDEARCTDTELAAIAAAYGSFGIVPFWNRDEETAYFHAR